jgi:subtilisin
MAVALTLGAAERGSAQAVREGFVNTPLPLGDDSYRPVEYGFDINYFGVHSDAGELCNNGYLILNYFAPSQPTCVYDGPLSLNSVPNLNGLRDFYAAVMVPYFSDVQATGPGSGQLLVGNGLVDGHLAWAATWDGVLSWDAPGVNTFQLALISLNDQGDFRMEFNYNDLAWNSAAIGFTNDDPAYVGNLGVARPSNSRLQCTFLQGNPTDCVFMSVTPEPATVTLFGSGLLGLLLLTGVRRRRRAAAGLSAAAALVTLSACSDSSALLRPESASLKVSPAPAPVAPPSQYIVLFKDGEQDLASSASPSGVELGKMRYVNGAVYAYVSDPDALRADPNVEAVVENVEMQMSDAYPVDAQYFAQGWQWDMLQIHANEVPVAYQGQGTRACIIDSGIDGTHQDLAGKLVASESFVSPAYGYPGPGPSPAPLDSNGHGTHVAGTVTTNGIGVASVAPGATLMAAKVFAATGSAPTAAIWDAISWCTANNADVINMSLGGRVNKPFSTGTQAARDEYAARIAAARNAGIVVVVAAGNDGLSINPSATYEIWPAQIPGAIAVGATAATVSPYYNYPFPRPAPDPVFDSKASYSNFGSDVDIWAPGGTNFINRIQANITSTCSSFRADGGCFGGKYYWGIAGTSMASPHVAGAAAVLTSRTTLPRGLARTTAIENCLLSTGDPITIANTPTRPRLNVARAATEACSGF